MRTIACPWPGTPIPWETAFPFLRPRHGIWNHCGWMDFEPFHPVQRPMTRLNSIAFQSVIGAGAGELLGFLAFCRIGACVQSILAPDFLCLGLLRRCERQVQT